MRWFKRTPDGEPEKRQNIAPAASGQAVPVEGVPSWMRASLLEWLEPIFYAVNDAQYHSPSGTPSTAFVALAERRLQITLDRTYGERGAIESLATLITTDEDLFLRVLQLAIENVHLGYEFRNQAQALAQLNRILTEAGSAWCLDIQRIETGEQWHGRKSYGEIRTLQRRTLPTTADALHDLSQSAPDPARHLGMAWNHAFRRNPDPARAYSEAIKAVEAAAIPVVLPNDQKATLGKVIGELRATPAKWQVVLAKDISPGGNPMAPIDVLTNLAALLWENQTDRHAPVKQPTEQAQAELAVHLALTLVHAFAQSVTPAP